MHLSDSLKQLFSVWMAGKNIGVEVARQKIDQYFAVVSWYSIMAGMGIFPDKEHLRPADMLQKTNNIEQIDNLIQRSLLNFRDHREVLMDIPAREPNALKVYYY